MAVWGVLASDTSPEELRVGVSLVGDRFEVVSDSGDRWRLKLERVAFEGWRGQAVSLRVGADHLLFIPDDRSRFEKSVLAAIRPEQALVPRPSAVYAGMVVPPGPGPGYVEADPDLVVDLTDEGVAGLAADEPASEELAERPAAAAVAAARTARPAKVRWGRVIVLGIVAGVLIASGIWLFSRSSDPAAELRDRLVAAGYSDLTITVEGGVATIEGEVAGTSEIPGVVALASGVEGIESVDARLTTPTAVEAATPSVEAAPAPAPEEAPTPDPPPPAEPGDLQEAASAALIDAGFSSLAVEVDGSAAALTGTVPISALADGFFAFAEAAEEAVLAVDGIETVSSRLQLRGNEALLRRELRALTEQSPITFEFGEAALTAEAEAVLEQAAQIIQANPGLRVLVAGHTDAVGSNVFNEELSNARAASVVDYLVEQGVAANRLAVAAYGELFPASGNESESDRSFNRRVEFEVAA